MSDNDTQTTYDMSFLGVGLVAASVCTSKPDDETTAWINREAPTGISSRWQVSDDETFADGTPNPSPCPDNPATHRHILFNC